MAFSGDYHCDRRCFAPLRVTGMSCALFAKLGTKSGQIAPAATRPAKYFLSVSRIDYVQGETRVAQRRNVQLEFSLCQSKREQPKRLIIARMDPAENCLAVALNSAHKYFCQIVLVSFRAGIGTTFASIQ